MKQKILKHFFYKLLFILRFVKKNKSKNFFLGYMPEKSGILLKNLKNW